MARLAMIGALLLAISPLGAMDDKKAVDPKSQLEALTKSFDQKMMEWQSGFAGLETEEEQRAHFQNQPNPEETATEIMALAAKHHEIGLDAVLWVMQNRVQGEPHKRALAMIKDHYLNKEEILPLIWGMSYGMDPTSGEILEKIVAESTVDSLKGVAHYSLAKSLLGKIEMAQYVVAASPEELEGMIEYFGEEVCAELKNLDAVAITARAEKLLDKVSTTYSTIPSERGGTLGDMASRELFSIRNLSVGKTAPEIEGEDLFGTTFKLSDYRGKVIFLDFWGDW